LYLGWLIGLYLIEFGLQLADPGIRTEGHNKRKKRQE
jgi:hypothetical protein